MVDTLSAIIVDDEFWARENLRELLAEHPQINVTGEASTVAEATRIIAEHKPDVLFLDIELGRGTGFDVLDTLPVLPHVVFVTAYEEFALHAFEVNALDYLLKPISRNRLADTVHRLAKQTQRQQPRQPLAEEDQIYICADRRHLLLPVRQIEFIVSERNYTLIMSTGNDNALKVRIPLHNWLKRLPFPPFIQLDRSTIINSARLADLSPHPRGGEVHFHESANVLPLGRSAITILKKHLNRTFNAP